MLDEVRGVNDGGNKGRVRHVIKGEEGRRRSPEQNPNWNRNDRRIKDVARK